MNRREIFGGAFLSYASLAFNIIAGLLYTPWMVSCIGNGNYGLYTLAISVVNLFLLDFGIGAAVSKFLSGFYAKGQLDKANAFLGIVLKLYLLLSAVVFIALVAVYLFIDGIYKGLTAEELHVFKSLYVVVALYSVVSFPFLPQNGILTANEKFISLKGCNLVQKVLNIALIVIALFAGFDVFALVAVNAITGLGCIAAKVVIIRKTTDVKVSFARCEDVSAKSLLSFSVWVLLIQISQRLVFSLIPTILGVYSGSYAIAIFGLAASIEGYVYSIADALNGMFLPEVSRLASGDNWSSRILKLMVDVGRVQLFLIGGIAVAFLSLGEHFVELWMGPGYEQLYLCIFLLIAPGIVEHTQQVGKSVIYVFDAVKVQSLICCVFAGVNVLLAVVLILPFGVCGAALSVFLCYVLRTIAYNVVYVRTLHLNMASFYRQVFLKWFIPAAVAGITSWLLCHQLLNQSLLAFCFETISFCVVYFLLLWICTFNDREKATISNLLKKLSFR